VAATKNSIPFKYVISGIWFVSAENMRFVKLHFEKDFIMALKGKRLLAGWSQEYLLKVLDGLSSFNF